MEKSSIPKRGPEAKKQEQSAIESLRDSINLENCSHLYFALTTSFDIDELDVDQSRGFPLTSVKAQCIKHRLNQVFGWNEWSQEVVFESGDHGVLAHSKLYTPWRSRPVESEGYSGFKLTNDGSLKPNAVGDAYKGARTDALSKGASCLGIANNVFMGNVCPYHVMSAKKSKEFLEGYWKSKEKWQGAFQATVAAVEKQQGGAYPKNFSRWNMKDMTALLTYTWGKK